MIPGASQPTRSCRAGDGGWSTPSLRWQVTPPYTLVRVQNALTSLQRGKHHLVWGAIFCKWRTVGNDEWYLCLKRDIHMDLWEQVEYLQCETQAVIEGDALILCESMNSSPYLVPHVAEGSLHFLKEGGQSPVILKSYSCISFHAAPALEWRWQVVASHSASMMSSHRIAE